MSIIDRLAFRAREAYEYECGNWVIHSPYYAGDKWQVMDNNRDIAAHTRTPPSQSKLIRHTFNEPDEARAFIQSQAWRAVVITLLMPWRKS